MPVASSVSLEIHSSEGSYTVAIACGSFHDALSSFDHPTLIADEFFRPVLKQPATFVRAIEENKSLDASVGLIENLRASGATRRTELVAVGGGILQDLSAFMASIYMRGLTWSYLPTTILAMVDSCIGGKSSINVGPYKNLVGTFHPPRQVLIDPVLAQTLPDEAKASGLVEAVKICFCRGEDSFASFLALSPSLTMPPETLQELILITLQAKKWFIEIDEFDQKERLLLNFGHTFGHAIEGATHYAIPHGIAVGLGILCAVRFGEARGTDYAQVPLVQHLRAHLDGMIRTLPGLADHLRAMPLADVFTRFRSDKKHTPDEFTLILVGRTGDVVLTRIPRSPASEQQIQQAVQHIVETYAA